jgi:hypothetical protein
MIGANLPFRWTGNELSYFSQAYRFNRDSHAFASGFPDHTKIVFNWSVRTAMEFMGTNTTWFTLRLTGYSLLAFAIAALAKSLSMNSTSLAIALFIYIQTGQTYMAGEWLIEGFESKIVAYSLVLYVISLAIARSKHSRYWLLPLAALFHPIVAAIGVAFLALLAFLTPSAHRAPRWVLTLLKPATIVALIATTMYLMGRSSGLPQILADYARQLYADRHPHHVMPFGSSGFASVDLVFFPMTVTLTLLAVRQKSNIRHRALADTLIVSHAFLPILLLLAFLDRNTYFLSPLYLFRYLSLLMLLSVLLLVAHFFGVTGTRSASDTWTQVTASSIAAVLLFNSGTFPAVAPLPLSSGATAAGQRFVEHVGEVTSNEEAILYDWEEFAPVSGLEELEIELLTGRGSFVNWKFVPTRSSDILEWERRRQIVRNWGEKTCRELSREGIALIVGGKLTEVPSDCGAPTIIDDAIWIYATRSENASPSVPSSAFRYTSGPVFLSGWSGPEEWGRWTEGGRAAMFVTHETHDGPCEIIIEGRGYEPDGAGLRGISIWANGSQLTEGVGADIFIGNVPLISLSSNESLGYLAISVQIADPLSPHEFNGSQDRRRLGFSLTGVKINCS